MESKAIKLAKKIATILNDEEYDDAVSALKIAKIMLPSPSVERKKQKKKEAAELAAEMKAATAGELVPADEQLMRFSKAMGQTLPPPKELDDEEGAELP
jgi:predicted transcriptional regulator